MSGRILTMYLSHQYIAWHILHWMRWKYQQLWNWSGNSTNSLAKVSLEFFFVWFSTKTLFDNLSSPFRIHRIIEYGFKWYSTQILWIEWKNWTNFKIGAFWDDKIGRSSDRLVRHSFGHCKILGLRFGRWIVLLACSVDVYNHVTPTVFRHASQYLNMFAIFSSVECRSIGKHRWAF